MYLVEGGLRENSRAILILFVDMSLSVGYFD
jgi:hypothetical protein